MAETTKVTTTTRFTDTHYDVVIEQVAQKKKTGNVRINFNQGHFMSVEWIEDSKSVSGDEGAAHPR